MSVLHLPFYLWKKYLSPNSNLQVVITYAQNVSTNTKVKFKKTLLMTHIWTYRKQNLCIDFPCTQSLTLGYYVQYVKK